MFSEQFTHFINRNNNNINNNEIDDLTQLPTAAATTAPLPPYIWCGQTCDSEAYLLSTALKVTSFPYLALLSCNSQRSVQMLDKLVGESNNSRSSGSINSNNSDGGSGGASSSSSSEVSLIAANGPRNLLAFIAQALLLADLHRSTIQQAEAHRCVHLSCS